MEIKPDYLRISLTDRCNLNCIYCSPLQRKDFLTHDEVLRYEEITKLVKIFVRLGVKTVRITGGEPLIKKNVAELISMLKNIKGLRQVLLTTNAILLSDYARELKQAGLSGVNISLDTLNKSKFEKITGFDMFDKVWKGIKAALSEGLNPVKLNVIPLSSMNLDEVADFARLTLTMPITVRFIELFHTNERNKKIFSNFVPSEKTKKIIYDSLGELTPITKKGNGPAVYYKLKNAKGAIGFINSTSGNFCAGCTRLRLDCAGKIYPCLFSKHIYDAKQAIRSNKPDNEIMQEISKAISKKPKYTKHMFKDRRIEMSSLGG